MGDGIRSLFEFPSGCISGSCVDGYCCDTACSNLCDACAAALKASGTGNGVCGAAKAGTDPHDDCIDDGASSCGKNGSCNGAGACQLYSSSTSCGATVCDGNIVRGQLCDGTGACKTTVSGTDCSPYFCGDGACPSSCSADAQCATGYYCDTAHHCAMKQANGTACTMASQCTSGHCVDGACCDTACNNLCEACTSALKESGTGDGICGAAKGGLDPHDDCVDDGASSCGKDGACNGAGACRLYGAATACGATVCDGNSVKGLLCNGTGTCQMSTSGTSCAPYLCQTGVCPTTCLADAQCASGYYCDAAKHCVSKGANGAACSVGNQCTSGYCVDGFCCDTACSNLCQACAASLKEQTGFCVDGFCCNQACTGACRACASSKTAHADGDCADIAAGTDPDNECERDPNNICGSDGMCNGAGNCRMKSDGFACGATQCAGNVVSGQICNGFGVCVSDATGTSCLPYLCQGDKCGTSCVSDSECVSEGFCNALGECTAKLAKGVACQYDKECMSGFCVDGVCRMTSCKGSCQACSAATKEDTDPAANGECGPAKVGTDPHDDCDVDAPSTCLKDGFCDGQGGCRVYPAGQACGATSCVGNEVTGEICDGAGACVTDQQGTDCSPYLCDGSVCSSNCVSASQCADGAWCTPAGECETRVGLGEPCTADDACSAGTCVDGLCCDKPCQGQCEACDVDGKLGTCSPVTGVPHGSRGACAGTGTSCEGVCDGVEAAVCAYPGSAVSCGSTCADGAQTTSICSGDGKCIAGQTTSCGAYVCDGDTACLSACATDDDCAGGFECDDTKCLPPSGGTCDGEHTVIAADGATRTDCTPYKCTTAGKCESSCTTDDQCATGFVCDTARSLCSVAAMPASAASAAPAGGDSGGCGCSTAGRTRAAWPILGLLALAGALARSRRSRSRADR